MFVWFTLHRSNKIATRTVDKQVGVAVQQEDKQALPTASIVDTQDPLVTQQSSAMLDLYSTHASNVYLHTQTKANKLT